MVGPPDMRDIFTTKGFAGCYTTVGKFLSSTIMEWDGTLQSGYGVVASSGRISPERKNLWKSHVLINYYGFQKECYDEVLAAVTY